MADEQISINNVLMTFNSADAFASIIDKITFKIDDNMKGLLHPSEVMKVAADAVAMSFEAMAEDIQKEQVLKHLTTLLVTTSELRTMINPKFMPTEKSIVSH